MLKYSFLHYLPLSHAEIGKTHLFILTQMKNNQIWPFEIKNCGGSEDYSDPWGGSVECVNSQSFLVRGPSNHKHYYILGPGESIYKTQLTYGNIKSVLQTIVSMLIVCMRWKNNSLKVNIFHIVIQWNQWNWESLAWFN